MTTDPEPADRTDLREAKRRWRARVKADRADLEIDSVGHCVALGRFLEEQAAADRYVVVFEPMPGEVDLGPLIASHPQPSRRYAVTRTPADGHVLTVHPYGGPVERHRYGFLQPTEGSPRIADERIGAVLVPALAFAADGSRLGRGKGYYDRFLARLGSDVLMIGVTGGYVVDQLPTEPFDVPMTHLATAEGVTVVPR